MPENVQEDAIEPQLHEPCDYIADSVPVLSHQSLLSLASYIKIDTMQSISYELGIPYEDIIQMKVTLTCNHGPCQAVGIEGIK